jgi:hypothetical protein
VTVFWTDDDLGLCCSCALDVMASGRLAHDESLREIVGRETPERTIACDGCGRVILPGLVLTPERSA